jgi:hypothetical protein
MRRLMPVYPGDVRRLAGVSIVVSVGAAAFFACVGSDPPLQSVGGVDDAAPADDRTTPDDAPAPIDGGGEAGPRPCPDPAVDASLAFTTALQLNPDFGGAAGADLRCAEAAIDGGLSGTFRAWISSDGTSAASRIVDPDPARPILLVGSPSAVIVACAAKLRDGALAHAIDRNQRGANVNTGEQVWTGTSADGGLVTDAGCRDWTATIGVAGVIGDPHSVSSAWTDTLLLKDCGGNARIYCIQVP